MTIDMSLEVVAIALQEIYSERESEKKLGINYNDGDYEIKKGRLILFSIQYINKDDYQIVCKNAKIFDIHGTLKAFEEEYGKKIKFNLIHISEEE